MSKLVIVGTSILLLVSLSATGWTVTSYDFGVFGSVVGGIANDDSVDRADSNAVVGYDDAFSLDVDSRIAGQGAIHSGKWSLIGQVALSGTNDFSPEIEWLYLGYTPMQGLTLRLGRLLLPVYHYSDHRQIGYTYPWVKLPVGIYNPFTASSDVIDGGSIFYEAPLGKWDLSFESYYGSIDDKFDFDYVSNTDGDGSFNIDDSVGLVVAATNSVASFRLGYHRSGSTTTQVAVPEYLQLLDALRFAGFSNLVDDLDSEDLSVSHYSVSTHLDYKNWIAGAEYTLVPADSSFFLGRENWYAMIGKQFNNWTFHFTYAEDVRDPEDGQSDPVRQQANALLNLDPTNPAIPQLFGLAAGIDLVTERFSIDHSRYTLGVRYDLNKPVSLKAQFQHVKDNQNKLSDNMLLVSFDFIIF